MDLHDQSERGGAVFAVPKLELSGWTKIRVTHPPNPGAPSRSASSTVHTHLDADTGLEQGLHDLGRAQLLRPLAHGGEPDPGAAAPRADTPGVVLDLQPQQSGLQALFHGPQRSGPASASRWASATLIMPHTFTKVMFASVLVAPGGIGIIGAP